MTLLGVLFMVASWSAITLVTIYCFYRILCAKQGCESVSKE